MLKAVKVPVGGVSKFYSIAPSLRALARDRKGVTAVVTALGATAIIGITGLAIDVASWEVNLREMQGADRVRALRSH